MYYILTLLARTLIWLLSRCRVEGKENVPVDGPLIVVSNHLSVSDPVLLGVKLGRRIIFMAKEELFQSRFISYFVREFGAFPVYRGQSNRKALEEAKRVLESGHVLGLFPEGKRSLENCLQTALTGSAFVAYHSRAAILPVAIVGSEAMRGFGWIWHRPGITIKIGRPFYLTGYERKLNKTLLAEYTFEIMEHITELLPEKYHGKYARSEGGYNENIQG
ncbi:MAG: 1-acyl-sn-glycerol-3-phosphate acyltransferase [Dehalococcoidales bacterium]|nr:1-acyl-sn-glycerol-3-phosphate acyltransferase [Dehalococcoidales bacterium]